MRSEFTAITFLFLLALTASASLPQFLVPNFSDLTVKTRRTTDDQHVTEEALYLKGPRERRESALVGKNLSKSITITQCDQRLRVSMNDKEKTYVSFPIEDWSERIKRARPIPAEQLAGVDVNVTIDSVDTGERRQFGNYTARRVKTTTKVEPGPGAVTPPSLTEGDGWYIDLLGLGCQDSRSVSFGWLHASSGKQDRTVLKRLGTAPRGYPLEETTHRTEAGRASVSKVELLEFSETPLDASLFELPAGYRPALRNPYGNYDMTKPATLANRLQAYWDVWRAWVRHWFL